MPQVGKGFINVFTMSDFYQLIKIYTTILLNITSILLIEQSSRVKDWIEPY